MEKKARGSQLLELVMNHLELREKEYFGLMFNDTGGVLPSGHSPDVMRWLDPLKPVRKQMRTAISGVGARTLPTLYLRVKFYVTGRCRDRQRGFIHFIPEPALLGASFYYVRKNIWIFEPPHVHIWD